MKIKKELLINDFRFINRGLLTESDIDNAIEQALAKIDANIVALGERFPTPQTFNNTYKSMDNIEWTNGFWTGTLWLAYEATGDNKYRELAEKHGESFLHRIENDIEVDHHDLGFLYSLSTVAQYKLTNNKDALRASLLAADKLMTRWQDKGQFIQAWGEYGAKDNYRLIVDALLNIPLLYWATEKTGDNKYRNAAEMHFETTVEYAIREDASAFHTFYFDYETGKPVRGATRQGYSDDSSWARGQAWLIYGIALNHYYFPKETNIELFEAITNYFLNRLPKDLVPYWDLIFDDSSGQSKDSSSAAIAVCGLNLMDRYIPESNEYKYIYRHAQHAILGSLISNYTETLSNSPVALINHGVYSWHSGKGVNEGNIWGDYFYLEALLRFKKDWKMYW